MSRRSAHLSKQHSYEAFVDLVRPEAQVHQVPSTAELHDEVHVLGVLPGLVEFAHVWVIQLLQHFYFFLPSVSLHVLLTNLLHSTNRLVLQMLRLEDRANRPVAYDAVLAYID